MLPPPLVPPLPTRPLRRPRRRIPWLALLGVLLVVAGIAGTIVWVGALSPYGFVRFSLPRADRTITISRAGEYLVFEEYAGATDRDLPSRLDISVVDDRARALKVEQLVPAGTQGAPFAYHVPPNEGRAIARFTAPRAGRYLLLVEPLDPQSIDPADYRPDLPGSLAVGRELSVAWLRTPLGFLVLGAVPFAAGVVVLVVARRRHRVVATAKPAADALESVR
jgi:hypothetical protein